MVQIYLHPGANLQLGANCAHERKPYNFYTFWLEISINGRHFLLRCCLNLIKNKFQVFFCQNNIIFIIWSFLNKISKHVWVPSIAPSYPHIFGIQTTGAVARLVACMQIQIYRTRVRLSLIFPSSADLREASCQLLAKRMGTRY